MSDHSTETDTTSDESEGARQAYPVLTVIHHPNPVLMGRRLVLAGRERFVLGRSGDTPLAPALQDGRVSREHAAVVSVRGDWELRDGESRNGTRVDGTRITRHVLRDGDVVQLGRVLLLHHQGPLSYERPDHPEIWGMSYSLSRTLASARLVARDDANAAIMGETGCGKDLVARYVHARSGRTGAFVPMNCGGLALGVLQSQLFGHLRGAFSGADVTRKGLVREAEGGTLFLDEVAAAPEELQATLLRLLESKSYRVVGASELTRANVRFICAVPPGVESLISEHRFRSDLWFRLTQRLVRLAALRNRREDIPLLAVRFARRVRNDEQVQIDVEFARALVSYRWPGNVRQLRSFVERAALDQHDGKILRLRPEHQEELRLHTAHASRPGPVEPKRSGRNTDPGREAIEEALKRAGGIVAGAARELGVARKTLYRWIDSHTIDVEQFRTSDDT